ncbi:WXG100 family type VII secretion target [Micromonospora sp. NPDC007271]|uniref:WXG100 family type VII secretion target n=1 Tax=Micromonospora sp. NPDC007271 TaxID=3154587 RepID=UPI0033E68CD0
MSQPNAVDVAQGYQQARDTWNQVTSPLSEGLNNALDTLLYPFVWPLLQLLELCIGDPDQLDAHSGAWQAAATQLRQLAERERADLAALRNHWEGPAADAYAKRITTLCEGLEAAAGEMARTADTLGDTAMDLRNCEEIIRTIIRELVEWLVITWLAAQALAIITAGASEAAAAVASAAETGVAVSRTTRIMAQLHRALEAYKAVMEALKAMGTVGKIAAWTINKLYGPKHWLKAGIKLVTPLDGSIVGEGLESVGDLVIDSAADEYDDRRRGDDGDGSRWRRTVSSWVDPAADRMP